MRQELAHCRSGTVCTDTLLSRTRTPRDGGKLVYYKRQKARLLCVLPVR